LVSTFIYFFKSDDEDSAYLRSKTVLIGVPKEIKNLEYRIGLTPVGVAELVKRGHHVLVQKDGGAGIGFHNDQYQKAGAEIIEKPQEIFKRAELVVKVK